ncbi:MAG: hypothetical protein ACI92I_000424 [Acidimicrobiales bacterium]|jgi:hypothetical protein
MFQRLNMVNTGNQRQKHTLKRLFCSFLTHKLLKATLDKILDILDFLWYKCSRMKKNTSPVALYTEAAKNLGLKTELVQSSHVRKRLLISNDKAFCLVSAGNPGFFPTATRWVAHFTGGKLMTQKILKRYGYNVISTTEVKISEYTSLKDFTQKLTSKHIKFPLLIKPDRGHDGIGIEIADNTIQFKKIFTKLYRDKKDFLIQPILNQNEYRILVVGGEVMLMHSKHKQGVTGDGTSTIKKLLSEVKESTKDPVYIKWQHQILGTKPSSVLPQGALFEYHLVKLPTNQYYKTSHFPAATREWAEAVAKTISSSVVGIDVFIPGDFKDTNKYTIIELNTNPALYYLPKRCDDDETAPRIIEKVLRDYFKLK